MRDNHTYGGSACAYDGVRDYGTSGGACHIEREQGRILFDGSMQRERDMCMCEPGRYKV